MFSRVLAPRPSAGPLFGPVASLATHVALVAGAVAGQGGAYAAAPDAAGDDERTERLHWIGVGPGTGGTNGSARGARDGAGPPLAYVIPGADGARIRLAGRTSPRRGGERAGAGDADARAAERPRATRALPALPTLPEITLPDAGATVVVAGVVASAADMARRVSRPDDFTALARSGPSTDALVGSMQMVGSEDARFVPIPLVGNQPPRYPAELARAHVGGRVVVEFLIDSTGAVDRGSLRVLESTHARFTDAVRVALPRLRFLPAQRDDRAVGVRVRQPFLFTVRPGV